VAATSDPHHGHDHGHDNSDEYGHDHEPIVEEPKHTEDHESGHAKPHHTAAQEHADEHVAEHVEHGAEPQQTGVNGHCPGNQSANSVAIGLMTSVILMPLIVYMTMTKAAKGAVSDLTYRMIDLSVSIFLAVLWFSATDDILESKHMHDAFPHAEEVFAILQTVILYVVTVLLAYRLRNHKYYFLTFCGCASHYIAFAGIKAAGETQHLFATLVESHYSVFASLGFCFLVFGVFALMSFTCFWSWRRYLKNDETQFAIEELEIDIIGLVLSFAIMQALRHALTGSYPAKAHLLLQQWQGADSSMRSAGSGCDHPEHHPSHRRVDTLSHHAEHTTEERMIMLVWSLGITLLACLSLTYLEDLKERSNYWGGKALHTVQVVLVMCAAWGYLLWGEWQFYETYFHGDKLFGKMVFAAIATLFCLMMITSLAYATQERSSNAKGYANLVVLAMGLVAAWSWEHCFHTAIDVIAEQYQVGYGGLVPKIIIALCVPLVILPGYIVFMKPIVVEIDDRVNKEEMESLRHHLAPLMYTADAPAVDAEGQEGQEGAFTTAGQEGQQAAASP
jgi:hypothetical protein